MKYQHLGRERQEAINATKRPLFRVSMYLISSLPATKSVAPTSTIYWQLHTIYTAAVSWIFAQTIVFPRIIPGLLFCEQTHRLWEFKKSTRKRDGRTILAIKMRGASKYTPQREKKSKKEEQKKKKQGRNNRYIILQCCDDLISGQRFWCNKKTFFKTTRVLDSNLPLLAARRPARSSAGHPTPCIRRYPLPIPAAPRTPPWRSWEPVLFFSRVGNNDSSSSPVFHSYGGFHVVGKAPSCLATKPAPIKLFIGLFSSFSRRRSRFQGPFFALHDHSNLRFFGTAWAQRTKR